MESPRVKTETLRPIFFLAYFTMVYVAMQEQILNELQALGGGENCEQQEGEEDGDGMKSTGSSPNVKQRSSLGFSPDINKLGIANIAINTTLD